MKESNDLPKNTLKTYKSFFFRNVEMDIVAVGDVHVVEGELDKEKKREKKRIMIMNDGGIEEKLELI